MTFFWAYVTRHICCCFDDKPSLRPPLSQVQRSGTEHQIALSSAQQDQIHEIFNLFDTDSGGTIDMGELDFAMSALGFRAKQADGSKESETDSEAKAALDAIAADGSAPGEDEEGDSSVGRCGNIPSGFICVDKELET